MFKNKFMVILLLLIRLIQKTLYSTKTFKGLTHWAFVPFCLTLIYTTSNFPAWFTKPWLLLLLSLIKLIQWKMNRNNFSQLNDLGKESTGRTWEDGIVYISEKPISQKNQYINPMSLCAPWADAYLHN